MFSDRFINLLDGNDSPTSDLAFAIQRAADDLASRRITGARVYYISRDCEFAGGVDLSPEVTVEIAPGARITLAAGARLVVRGRVSLGMGQHFSLGSSAEVHLLGEIDGVRPDWFWDRSSAADDALDAAFALVQRRAAEGVEAVPLRLSSNYPVTRPWSLRPTSVSVLEVEIVGRHPVGDPVTPPTIEAADGSFLSALVEIGLGVSVRVDRVAFSRGRVAPIPGAVLVTLEGDNDESRFTRCSFFCGGGSALIARALLGSDDERLGLVECWIDAGAPVTPGVDLLTFRSGGRRSRVSIEGCRFVGNARSMISVSGGVAEVLDCTFLNHNAEGCDIQVEWESAEAKGDPGARVVDLAVTHARSGSWTHLRGDSTQGSAGSVSLTGLSHVPPGRGRPAVSWRGQIASGLLLQGCNLGGSIDVDRRQRVVLLAVYFRDGVSAPTNALLAARPAWLG
jgi:hypothetical protein